MANYFNHFPLTYYSGSNTTSLNIVTNIIARFGFEKSLKQNSSAFYEYQIKESDTPEIIASKIYGSPERHWIVLMFNDIMDPQYDWPLQYDTLVKYIDQKYSKQNYADTANSHVSGLSWAMSDTHTKAYYKIITRKANSSISGVSIDAKTIVEKIEIDGNTYANVIVGTNNATLQSNTKITETTTKEKISYYDYEVQLNEDKRTIRLLKPEFVKDVIEEFKDIITK
jgi:hypothetical protein